MSEKHDVPASAEGKPELKTVEFLQDESSRYYVAHFESQSKEWRENRRKKLLRKIDMRLLPSLVLVTMDE
jgi:hypothetical protein